ncbi:MAG: phosphate ABC transporter substrate-binding protein PstS [Alphaproteobacteria bacterium]|nr:phosphate ABC transporter substrate-binding protein PstS [Alphaproteobacteria bacterium]
MKLVPGLLAVAIAGAAVAAASAAGAQQITGAGATFPAPVYTKWAEAARAATGIQLNYQAIGSGGGQNQIINRTVDFGASDAPVDAQRLEQNHLLQFPTVMGAVVPIVNLPAVQENQLKLTGELLGDIFLGKIANWNDPKIAELNPGVKLPHLAIAPVHRADGSGTTFVFTSYLSATNPGWKSQVGAATSVDWQAGTGARGNDGVAGTVHNTRGGIGYVEYAYAKQNHLITAQLRNKSGQFVVPAMPAFAAAASSADWAHAQHFAVDLIDLPGPTAWPIVSATFILLPENPTDPARSAAVLKFFDWAYKNGDPIAASLDYIPMPQAVKEAVETAWHGSVKGPDGKPVF